MEPTVMEECASLETPSPQTLSYDDVFPALKSNSTFAPASQSLGPWNNTTTRMRISSSNVTQVFKIPVEQRRDANDKFGEGENHNCSQIMKETGTTIEINSSKDRSLTFLVQGKPSDVAEAKKRILSKFQSQSSMQIQIPCDHHRHIVGKSGQRLKDLEKLTDTKISIPRANEESDTITISGPKEGIEKAMDEIRTISLEISRQGKEQIPVPKQYHPFITGENNEKLNALMDETGAEIKVPPLSVSREDILLLGEKHCINAAKERINAICDDLEKRFQSVSIEVPISQHKYISGQRGQFIIDILSTTGVTVEMPKPDSGTSSITLKGPHEKIGPALTMVYEKANSMLTEKIVAPAWIHKHIIGPKGSRIRELTQDAPKVHVKFEDGDVIKVEGPREEVTKMSGILNAIVKDMLANMVTIELNVDVKYHKHIIGKSGVNINKLKDETGASVTIAENDQVIRIDGKEDSVQKAKKEILDMVNKLKNETEKDIKIDHKYHRHLIGSKGGKIKDVRDKYNQVQIMFPDPGESRDVVKLRGPKKDVEECHKCLNKLVEEIKAEGFTLEVHIQKQFHRVIIGKEGSNIKKIRDDTQTNIDVPGENDTSDVIVITGREPNVKQAREQIQKIQNELLSGVSEELTIPHEHHKSLIGPGGKLIHSITEECGNVIIKFPDANSNSNKVVIRGAKDDVERAKQQLLKLTNERQQASFTEEIRAKPHHHKFLIGKNGANIKRIRDSTGARVIFPTERDEDKELITIIGKKESVEAARAELEAVIKEIANTIESTMTVDPKHHRHFVTRRGEVLHRISDECGGVSISFPRAGESSDRVTLKGSKDSIEAAKARILEIVNDLETSVTIDCIIPQTHHRTIMGARGSKVQNIQADHNVHVKFPDRVDQDQYIPTCEQNGSIDEEKEIVRNCDVIRITGKAENCEAAKQALLNLIPVNIEVNVPFKYHGNIIGQKGRDVRELTQTYDVHIFVPQSELQLDTIEITGAPACVQAAKEAIEQRCKNLEADEADRELRSYEVKVEVHADYHSKLIGRKGAVISKIRSDHNVQINFPKRGAPEQGSISIMGYEADVHAARDAIMKIVNDLNDLTREDLDIDSRVHSRLIGSKGRNLRKITEEYGVDVKFPKPSDPNPNIVTIMGQEEKVLDCKYHILNLVEEFMQDLADQEYQDSFIRKNKPEPVSAKDPNDGGILVKGGPWEQKAPNMESKEDFPTFGGAAASGNASSMGGVWGSSRKVNSHLT